MSTYRIVIIGGGFAGVKCASTLRKQLSKQQYEIVLFNKENHMVFHPLLAEVVGASLSAEDVIAPLRQMLPGVHCRTEDVRGIDLKKNIIEYEGYDTSSRYLSYDHVVICCGGAVNLGTVPGMADHAFPLKTIGDAINLRAHIMQQFEKAEVCDNPQEKLRYLSFIVVGGGYSGVEVAGEINDLAKNSSKFFQNIKKEDISITLIHSQSQLLPEIGEELREFAREKMQQAGIKIILNHRVTVATPEGVGLDDHRSIMGGTIVCTIGTKVAPVVEKLDTAKKNGRVVTKADMSLLDYNNAWAMGDCAQIINSFDNKLSAPTGQFAERQGRQVANNIVATFQKQPTKPFYFRPLGQLCSLGGHQAVAEMFGVKISGFLAWFIWRGVYLLKLPSWSRRIKAGFDWAWQLVFSKDLAHLKANLTERVSHAHYEAGDYIFRQGDPASYFYIIEKGDVEIVREDTKQEVLAVLGQGSYFGEMALVNDNPRSASVRARTAVEVIIMGRKIFKEITSSLGPLNHLIMHSVSRRTEGIGHDNPMVRQALQKCSVTDLMEVSSQPILSPNTTFGELLSWCNSNKMPNFFYVSNDAKRLDGVLTRTDLLHAIESGANGKTKVADFMVANPIAVSTNDSALVAATTMRDYELSWLPVVSDLTTRQIKGYIQAQELFTYMLTAIDGVEKNNSFKKTVVVS